MNFLHTIKFRFTIWYLLILAILLIGLSFGIYTYFSRSLSDNLDDSLKLRTTQLQSVRGVIDSIGQGSFEEKLGEVVVFYVDTGKTVRYVSTKEIMDPLEGTPQIIEQALQGESQYVTVETEALGKLRFHVVPFTGAEYAMIPRAWGMQPTMVRFQSAAVAVGRSTADVDEALDRLRSVLVLAIPLTLIIAGAGGVFLARRALKPVDEIASTAIEIEETDLSRRIPVRTKDELGRLSSVLNQMIERLQRAFKRQQEFTGDASHELRSPLSVIQAESTLALERERSASEYRKSLEVIAQESVHMSTMIDQLLTLARADAGSERMQFEEFDLSALLNEVASNARLLAQGKEIVLEFSGSDHLVVYGDRGRLKELFANLLDNAIRYTAEGGRVSLSSTSRDGWAIIFITDTGIGIAAPDLPFIFERFYRVDKARSRAEGGSGLGLAICRHITDSHGGSIKVESEPGKGSTFTVRLPVVDVEL